MESFQQILGRHFNFFSYIFHMPNLHKFWE
jgi:hypothetical protein